jgi:hypothetical protein
MFMCRRIPVSGSSFSKKDVELDTSRQIPFVPDPEPLVEEDQASPVGFRVKQIPGTRQWLGTGILYVYLLPPCQTHNYVICTVDYKLDTSGASKPYLPAKFLVCEIILGLIMASGIGGFIIYSSFTTWDDSVTSKNYTIPGLF